VNRSRRSRGIRKRAATAARPHAIRPGFAAAGDPLAGVTALENVGFVMKEGSVYKQ